MQSATYDHVDDDGNLILTIDGGQQVALAVTDKLEQAIISAQQIQSEARAGQRPVEVNALPLSKIQTMVREGRPYKQIAEKYNIDETLVRRYAQPVEQEKNYAISQFMSVRHIIDGSPRADAHGFITQNTRPVKRTIGDLLNENFARARVDAASVDWTATRFRREPWKITATFSQNGHQHQAIWTWDMRGDSVICINPVASRLLGQGDDASTILFGDEQHDSSREASETSTAAAPVPGGKPVTVIDRSSTSASASDMPTDRQQDNLPTSVTLPVTSPTNDDDDSYGLPHYPTFTETMNAAKKMRLPGEPELPVPANPTPASSPAAVSSAAAPAAEETSKGAKPSKPTASDEDADHAGEQAKSEEPSEDEDSSANEKKSQNATRPQQKRRRRSAVPSWDEIIFG